MVKGYKCKKFYPSLVSFIWKNIERIQMILNQPIINEYRDFDIQFVDRVLF